MIIYSPYVSPNYRTGGQKRHLQLLEGLRGKGHRVVLFKDRNLTFPENLNIEIINLTIAKRFSRDRAFAKSLSRYFKSVRYEKPDWIIQFGESAFFAASLIKKQYDGELLVALRNNWVDANRLTRRTWPSGIKWKIKGLLHSLRDRSRERMIACHADRIIFQSFWDRDAFLSRQSFSTKKISIIPNSIRAAWFDPAYRQTNHSRKLKKICFIGNEDPRKGLEFLLQAFAKVKQENPHLVLDVLGRYPERLIGEYSSRGFTDGVTFQGVQSSTLPALQQADLFIIPSLYDSFPNTLLEALFVGTPSCGSETAGIIDMLDDKDILFTPGSAKAIEEQLKKWLNSDFYNQKASYCRTIAQKFDFDWIEKWEQALKTMIGDI